MKRLTLYGIAIAPVALIIAGSSLAAAPEGLNFNDWSAEDGVITLRPDGLGGSNCIPPACVILLRENGLLQARVRANDDLEGDGFFHTISVNEGFTGTPGTADFRSESFVAPTNQAANFDMAVLSYVDLDGEGMMQASINGGTLRDADNNEPSLQIYQNNTLTGFGNVDFLFERQVLGGAQFSTGTTAGAFMRLDYTVDNVTGNRGTPMTIRQTSGFYTQGGGTLTNVAGDEITYSEGQHIGTMFMTGLLWHGGPMHMPANADRAFELQTFNNFTTSEFTQWTNVEVNLDDTGLGYVRFPAVWQAANAGDALWDDNFGTSPIGITAPDNFGTIAFPDFPAP